MNKYISLTQLIVRRATVIQDPPSYALLEKVRAEVTCYQADNERSLADIGHTPQESPVWFIPGFGYAPVREHDAALLSRAETA
jgi:hypothetical protein